MTGDALDGDQDGQPGGDFVFEFSVSTPAIGQVFEGTSNATIDSAVSLLFPDDPDDNGWLQSQWGLGNTESESDQDWWRFEGKKGDFAAIQILSYDLNTRPYGSEMRFQLDLYHDDQRVRDLRGGRRERLFRLPHDGTYSFRIKPSPGHNQDNTISHGYQSSVYLFRPSDESIHYETQRTIGPRDYRYNETTRDLTLVNLLSYDLQKSYWSLGVLNPGRPSHIDRLVDSIVGPGSHRTFN